MKKEKAKSKPVKKTAKAPRAKKAKLPELCVYKTCGPDDRKFQGLCRKCYVANWQVFKAEKQQKAQRRLNAYVEAIAQKYPKDYMERIKDGLENEDVFNKMVQELELDEEAVSETEREYLEKLSRKVGQE